MRYLRLLSIAMTISGVLLAVASTIFDFGGALTLTGLMLVIAGVVKIVTVAIWHGIVGLGPIKTTHDS